MHDVPTHVIEKRCGHCDTANEKVYQEQTRHNITMLLFCQVIVILPDSPPLLAFGAYVVSAISIYKILDRVIPGGD